MLFSWLTLALVAYVAKGGCTQSGSANSVVGTHNYVIDLLNGMYPFAYAINQCTQTSLTNAEKWFIYTCSSDKQSVQKTGYTDSACTTVSDQSTDSMTFQYHAVPPGYVGDFKCDGSDTYGKVSASTSSDCSGAITVYAGLNACVTQGKDISGQTSKFYCDSNGAQVQFFMVGAATSSTTSPSNVESYMSSDVVGPTQSGGGDVCSANFCTTWAFSIGCQQVTTLPNGATLYGGLVECLSSDNGSKAASTQFVVMNLFFVLASLIWFF